MRAFDHQLLRLKQRLGVSEDQEVAHALGLSKAALADRKKRDAFPVDKLKALAADQPELGIDVQWVLTGVGAALDEKLQALKEATSMAVALGLPMRDGEFVRDVVFGARTRDALVVREAIANYVAERLPAKKPVTKRNAK